MDNTAGNSSCMAMEQWKRLEVWIFPPSRDQVTNEKQIVHHDSSSQAVLNTLLMMMVTERYSLITLACQLNVCCSWMSDENHEVQNSYMSGHVTCGMIYIVDLTQKEGITGDSACNFGFLYMQCIIFCFLEQARVCFWSKYWCLIMRQWHLTGVLCYWKKLSIPSRLPE